VETVRKVLAEPAYVIEMGIIGRLRVAPQSLGPGPSVG
jgi:hypothetical protein